MAFAYVFHANFNAGDATEFDAGETDVSLYLNVRDYKFLAKNNL